jgi:hypothetical protein
VLCQDVGDARPCERLALRIQEELGHSGLATDSQPGSQAASDLLPERQNALLSSLAPHEHIRVGTAEGHVVEAQADDLGHTQAAGQGEMKQRPITDAVARRRVRRVKQRLLLWDWEMKDYPAIRPLYRDSQHTANLLKCRRDPVFDVPHERFDGDKARVTSACAVAAVLLQVLKEGHDEGGVDLFEMKLRRLPAQSLAGELE